MLKTLKYRLYEIIKENGLTLDLFGSKEENGTFLITFIDTPLYFSMKQSERNFNNFQYSYTRFRPKFPEISSHDYVDFSLLDQSFNFWIKQDVKKQYSEFNVPDLWENYANLVDLFHPSLPPEHEFQDFSDAEKVHVSASIDDFKLLIENNFHPIEEQLIEINKHLDYLSNAVDRLNRFDWRALFITTVWEIGIALALDPEGVRRLSELLRQAFTDVIGLLT